MRNKIFTDVAFFPIVTCSVTLMHSMCADFLFRQERILNILCNAALYFCINLKLPTTTTPEFKVARHEGIITNLLAIFSI